MQKYSPTRLVFLATHGECVLQAVATAVDTFVVMLETHRWVASSSLASRSRRTDDSSSGDAPVGKGKAPTRVAHYK